MTRDRYPETTDPAFALAHRYPALPGFLGGASGGVAQLIIGGVIMKYGYGPIFAVCSVMYLAALAAVHILIGELGVIRKMPLPST
ncbi:MAG: hypothetical protein ABSH34_03090 [Verrucomicrobiota bacterium]